MCVSHRVSLLVEEETNKQQILFLLLQGDVWVLEESCRSWIICSREREFPQYSIKKCSSSWLSWHQWFILSKRK